MVLLRIDRLSPVLSPSGLSASLWSVCRMWLWWLLHTREREGVLLDDGQLLIIKTIKIFIYCNLHFQE